jgi:hypothetical protein
MTFHIYIYPEQALLLSVRNTLSEYPAQTKGSPNAYLASGAACALSLQGALEAIVNSLLQSQRKLEHWDEFRFLSKIDTIAELSSQKIEWGSRPWQEIARLVRLRNWLAHNKDPVIGLINSQGKWLTGGLKNRIPKFDPQKELRQDSIRSFYDAVREAGLLLAEMVGSVDEVEYLKTESYQPRLVG